MKKDSVSSAGKLSRERIQEEVIAIPCRLIVIHEGTSRSKAFPWPGYPSGPGSARRPDATSPHWISLRRWRVMGLLAHPIPQLFPVHIKLGWSGDAQPNCAGVY